MYCAVGVVQPSGRSFSQLILGGLEVLCSEPCFRPWVCPCAAPFVELKGNGSACIARSLWEAFASRSLTDALQHKRSSELGLQAACVRASELQGCCSHWGRRNGKRWLILSTLKHSTPSPTLLVTLQIPSTALPGYYSERPEQEIQGRASFWTPNQAYFIYWCLDETWDSSEALTP